jgi:hypothetical protein
MDDENTTNDEIDAGDFKPKDEVVQEAQEAQEAPTSDDSNVDIGN